MRGQLLRSECVFCTDDPRLPTAVSVMVMIIAGGMGAVKSAWRSDVALWCRRRHQARHWLLSAVYMLQRNHETNIESCKNIRSKTVTLQSTQVYT